VTAYGVIAVTVLRAVGWLARLDLVSRPIPAGPGLEAPGAQCPDGIRARITLAPAGDTDGRDGRDAWAGELGFRAVPAGDAPVLAPDIALVGIDAPNLELVALKPAEDGDGFVVRLLNPTDTAIADAAIRFALPVAGATSVRLDETPDGGALRLVDATVQLEVGPHALRSVRVRVAAG
jgi:alpha-mannosidase/mannosylglycerate hydrolase